MPSYYLVRAHLVEYDVEKSRLVYVVRFVRNHVDDYAAIDELPVKVPCDGVGGNRTRRTPLRLLQFS